MGRINIRFLARATSRRVLGLHQTMTHRVAIGHRSASSPPPSGLAFRGPGLASLAMCPRGRLARILSLCFCFCCLRRPLRFLLSSSSGNLPRIQVHCHGVVILLLYGLFSLWRVPRPVTVLQMSAVPSLLCLHCTCSLLRVFLLLCRRRLLLHNPRSRPAGLLLLKVSSSLLLKVLFPSFVGRGILLEPLQQLAVEAPLRQPVPHHAHRLPIEADSPHGALPLLGISLPTKLLILGCCHSLPLALDVLRPDSHYTVVVVANNPYSLRHTIRQGQKLCLLRGGWRAGRACGGLPGTPAAAGWAAAALLVHAEHQSRRHRRRCLDGLRHPEALEGRVARAGAVILSLPVVRESLRAGAAGGAFRDGQAG
mmetsp:Transcript_34144/g.96751  ORF Transcript_34144/g.96751 Transcript_34144/m.96751 type:complete len:367 (+) Transcript_34144:1394-2494(+)